MPFQSEKQRKFMFTKHPDIAHRWSKKYGNKPISKKAIKKRLLKGKKHAAGR